MNQILAAAYAAAAQHGTDKAVEMLQDAIYRLKQDEWSRTFPRIAQNR